MRPCDDKNVFHDIREWAGGVDEGGAELAVSPRLALIPSERRCQLFRMLSKLIGSPDGQSVPECLVVDDEARHRIEEVPDIDLVLRASAEECHPRSRRRRERFHTADIDLPGELGEPTLCHRIGGIDLHLVGVAIYPMTQALPVGIDRKVSTELRARRTLKTCPLPRLPSPKPGAPRQDAAASRTVLLV